MSAPATAASTGRRSSGPVLALRIGAVGLVVAALVAGAVSLGEGDEAPAALDPATLVPSTAPVDPDAWLPDRLDPVPAVGATAVLTGPFDQSAAVAGLRLVTGEGASVEGTVQVTDEVSDVIALELQAAWYDAGGELLGSSRLVVRQEDFSGAAGAGVIASEHGAPLPFRIEAPADFAPRVASSAVGLPGFVTE